MRKTAEWSVIFLIGAAAYSMLEILWRGYTHWSMTLTGGVCFLVLYALHIYGRWIPFLSRCIIGALAITAAEFTAGCIVNLYLGWEVWDYSDVPLNILGQICPLYSLLWCGLCALSSPLCRRLAKSLISDKNTDSSCNSTKSVI